MILIFSYLHRNQRLVLHLNLLARVLSNREIPFQALISHHKTSNKENYKNWKSESDDAGQLLLLQKYSNFYPAKDERSPTTNLEHRDTKLAAGQYMF